LIQYEQEFSDLLLDLYNYYCVVGISNTSPITRAAALSMLQVIVAHNYSIVVKMLGNQKQ
jgi:hypothetical protein